MMDTAIRTIESSECRKLLAEDPAIRILDVRTGGEFESVHIPGSYNVPLEALREHAAELASLDQPLVLVCRSGARASQANAALAAKGTRQLLLLDGGIDAWQASGGDVNQGGAEKWALDRQVRLVAGSISLAAVVASVIVPQAKWLAGGVAAGLTFSAVSNTCAMGDVLAKLPYNQSAGSDIPGVLAALRSGEQSNVPG